MKKLLFVLMMSLVMCLALNAQQVILDGDGTSERVMIIRNEGNVNSHTYFSAVNASDQINTTPTYEGWRSRGTLDNQLDVTTGDRILALMGLPYVAGSYRPTSAIEIWAGNTPGANSYPTYITMSTTDNNQTVRQERIRVAENGNVGINTTDPSSKLQVSDGDIYIEDINNGVIMKSPDGNCWRYSPDNSGNLVGAMIVCPN